jgi:hypothetical protein
MRVVGKSNGKHYEITEVRDNEVIVMPRPNIAFHTEPKYLRKVLKEIKP